MLDQSCGGAACESGAVNNGDGTWNVYFGGWDGVSSCHDSVSIVVTEDTFATLNPHDPQLTTGEPWANDSNFLNT